MQLIFPNYNCLWDSQVYNDLLRSNPFMTCFIGCCMFSDERMFSEYFLKFLLLNIQFNNNYFKANLVSEWPEQRRLSYFKNIVVRLKVLIADHLFNIFSVIIGFGEAMKMFNLNFQGLTHANCTDIWKLYVFHFEHFKTAIRMYVVVSNRGGSLLYQ